MTKDQLRARDFVQLATIHAASGEKATREIIDGLEPAARDELYTMSHALTQALKTEPGAAGARTVDTGIAASPSAIAAKSESTDDRARWLPPTRSPG